MRDKVISAEQAACLVKSGDVLAMLGSGGGVIEPTCLIRTLGERFAKEGLPRDLTIFHASGLGDKQEIGTDYLAQEGLVKRDIAGHWGMAPKMARLAQAEKVEAYNFPQGVMSQLYVAIAAGKPGVITKTGLGTFVDPRLEGGKMNKSATEDIVRVLEIDGEEWLFFPRFKIDVCFIRGTTADLDGNITMEQEAAILEGISIAQATKNSGGIVIAQVKYLAQRKTLKAQDVRIPGIYVDHIVVDPDQKQTCLEEYNPALCGAVSLPLERIPPLPLDERKVIARRAAKELFGGAVVNLGVGMPSGVAAVAAEDGSIGEITFTVEQGLIGGMPAGGVVFGVAYNPVAIIDESMQFNFYDGGGLDVAFLGMAQVDGVGNVNTSKTGALLTGCGGFINISQNAKKVVFCGTFTVKGLEVEVGGGRLKIVREGQITKFRRQVDQITYSGEYAAKVGQKVLYVTDRAVFELSPAGLVLTEIAPGIDLEKDVLAYMAVRPVISPALRLMDEDIFR
ncbi:MAG: CoA-transferase [Negativicutes bacterium]|nr:CoA-transferase [Negativicutes bacterium]